MLHKTLSNQIYFLKTVEHIAHNLFTVIQNFNVIQNCYYTNIYFIQQLFYTSIAVTVAKQRKGTPRLEETLFSFL